MTPRPVLRHSLRLCPLALCLVACGAPTTDPEPSGRTPGLDPANPAEAVAPVDPASLEPPAPEPWTDAFEAAGTLLAQTIRIEGPAGLREHLALVIDDVRFVHETRMTEDGLRQTVRPKPGTPYAQAQLDRWQLAGIAGIEVLERPGGTTVRVVATGAAAWLGVDGQEQRADRLVFEGAVEP